MERTKNFCKFLEDISTGVQFYKAAALDTPEENCNHYAKILITHTQYRRANPEVYLEPSCTSMMERSCKKKLHQFFQKRLIPHAELDSK